MSKEKEDLSIKGSEYNKFNGSCVYAWKRGEEWLYVGTSTRGLSRLYSHTTIDIIDKVLDDDTILVWTYEDTFQAQVDEVELIILHTPKYNKLKDVNILFNTLFTISKNKNKKVKRKSTKYWEGEK